MYRMHPMRWIWIGLGVLLLAFGGLWLVSRTESYPYGYRMPMMGGFPLGIFGAIFFFVLVMLVLRLVFWGSYGGYRRGYLRESQAEEILRERYARGEITKEQFDQMMRDVQRDRS